MLFLLSLLLFLLSCTSTILGVCLVVWGLSNAQRHAQDYNRQIDALLGHSSDTPSALHLWTVSRFFRRHDARVEFFAINRAFDKTVPERDYLKIARDVIDDPTREQKEALVAILEGPLTQYGRSMKTAIFGFILVGLAAVITTSGALMN